MRFEAVLALGMKICLLGYDAVLFSGRYHCGGTCYLLLSSDSCTL